VLGVAAATVIRLLPAGPEGRRMTANGRCTAGIPAVEAADVWWEEPTQVVEEEGEREAAEAEEAVQ
jgi:hypothetical protein